MIEKPALTASVVSPFPQFILPAVLGLVGAVVAGGAAVLAARENRKAISSQVRAQKEIALAEQQRLKEQLQADKEAFQIAKSEQARLNKEIADFGLKTSSGPDISTAEQQAGFTAEQTQNLLPIVLIGGGVILAVSLVRGVLS